MNARKRGNLSAVIDADETATEVEDQQTAQAEAGDTAQVEPAKKATRTPRKKGAPAAKKTTTRPAATKKTAAPKTPAKTPAKPAPEPIRVKATDAKAAKKVSLYLHPEDFRDLGMAKLDDEIDANSRIRAMIALWRDNPRVRAQVDKLAGTAPRGGML